MTNAFRPLASHPECTHRPISAYNVAETGEPLAHWSCSNCGRRFGPTEPTDENAYQLADPSVASGRQTTNARARSWAGALTGTYGSSDEVRTFVRREHHAWEEGVERQMKIEIETAPNGYVIRAEEGDILEVVENDDEVEAAREMLWSVNEHVGHPGSRHDEHRIRIITPAGDHWMPAKRDTCKHDFIERSDYGEVPTWRCVCGAKFGQLTPGSSWEDELEADAASRQAAPPDPGEVQTES